MIIRNSSIQDLAEILEIYNHARKFMKENANPRQWGDTWPPEELLRKDISSGKSYVCLNEEKILGTFFYDYGDNIESTYEKITDGSWISSKPYGVIHRIASAGIQKGIGEFCINWAYERSGHLRMDTHNDNIVMQKLLSKLSFKKCGTIYVYEDNDPRIAYEKI